jgi:hypothetical protein
MEHRKLVVLFLLLLLIASFALNVVAMQSTHDVNAQNLLINKLNLQKPSYYYVKIQNLSNYSFLLTEIANYSHFTEKVIFNVSNNGMATYTSFLNITPLNDGGFYINTNIPNVFELIYKLNSRSYIIWSGNLTNSLKLDFNLPMTGTLQITYFTPEGAYHTSLNLSNGYVFEKILLLDYKPKFIVESNVEKVSPNIIISISKYISTINLNESNYTIRLIPSVLEINKGFATAMVGYNNKACVIEMMGIDGKPTLFATLFMINGTTALKDTGNNETLAEGILIYNFTINGQKSYGVATNLGLDSTFPLNSSIILGNSVIIKINGTNLLLYPNGTLVKTNIFQLRGSYSFVLNDYGFFSVKEYVINQTGIAYTKDNVSLYYQNMTPIRDIFHINNSTYVYVYKGETLVSISSIHPLVNFLIENMPFMIISVILSLLILLAGILFSRS